MANETQLKLLVHCFNMPGRTYGELTDIRLGIQKGKEVIDEVPADQTNATFTASVRVERKPPSNNPNFLGPYAHGTPQQRFLYLSWSGVSNGDRKMFRRAKLQLGGITWDDIDRAVAADQPLEVTLDMTSKHGGPACATLKVQGVEWQLRKST